ncbi:CopD family protein [Haladaptatus pallidirubidus]|uniref:Copper resistance protein D domain-containing protein n=1 Tax=Haladaptatus pallidirubidus TaxID=1008152 RepID=A0AAV3UK63_9EURY|nr:CopD family protein [Haladaptatus pallidirubidus]
MALIDVLMQVLHTVFAGVWAGWTLFMAVLVIPAARKGHLGTDGLRWLTKRFSRFSMLASLVLFTTGGHLAGTRYTVELLGGSSRGHLVLTMVALWFVLTGLSHAASSRLMKNLDDGAMRAASAYATWFYAAGVVAVGLLIVAGRL